MTSTELRKPYRDFYVESAAGQHARAELDRLIDLRHKDAEDNPDHARDYMQQAKGIRLVIQHIDSIVAKTKVEAEETI